MTPRIGVYQHDSCLYDVLCESYHGISNRELLCALVSQPFFEIRKDIAEGNAGDYVLRERHRRWVENVEEHVGLWIPLPDFELIAETGEWCEESGMCDAFFCDSPEWVLFGDDIDVAFDVIDKLPYTVWMDDNLEAVVASVLALNPNAKDLIVSTRDLFAIYVLRSTKVENHGINVEDLAQSGFHAFSDLAHALEPGDYPTYVLDDETVTAWVRELHEQEEWERRYNEQRMSRMQAGGGPF